MVKKATKAKPKAKAAPAVALGALFNMREVMTRERKLWSVVRQMGKRNARRLKVDKDGFTRSFVDFEFNTTTDAEAFIDLKVLAAGVESLGLTVAKHK